MVIGCFTLVPVRIFFTVALTFMLLIVCKISILGVKDLSKPCTKYIKKDYFHLILQCSPIPPHLSDILQCPDGEMPLNILPAGLLEHSCSFGASIESSTKELQHLVHKHQSLQLTTQGFQSQFTLLPHLFLLGYQEQKMQRKNMEYSALSVSLSLYYLMCTSFLRMFYTYLM